MYHSLLVLLAAAAHLASAIQFTNPSAGQTLKRGDSFDLEWSSVDTDPSEFSIYLWNFVVNPPYYTILASNVQTSAGSYEITVPCDVTSGDGYQFNAINGCNVYDIFAQTSKFTIDSTTCSSPNVGSNPYCPAGLPSNPNPGGNNPSGSAGVTITVTAEPSGSAGATVTVTETETETETETSTHQSFGTVTLYTASPTVTVRVARTTVYRAGTRTVTAPCTKRPGGHGHGHGAKTYA